MTAATEAFGNVDVKELYIEGGKIDASIRGAITSARVKRPIDSAPTLTLGIVDEHRRLLKSGVFSSTTTCQLNGFGFELADIKKQGSILTLVFEDITVAALRKITAPRKIAAGAMTRAEFIRQLVRDAGPWVKVTVIGSSQVTRSDLARGTVLDETATPQQRDALARKAAAGNLEDTWAATGRLAEDVQWVRFVRNSKEFVFAEESALAAGTIYAILSEDHPAVINIDFDWDTGKEDAKATVRVHANRWTIPPGSRLKLTGLGPASKDNWIVRDIERSLFSTEATVTLALPRPTLDEPESASSELGEDAGYGEIIIPPGYGDEELGGGPISRYGFIFPVKSVTVNSKFGMRNGRMHEGVDFETPDEGVPVYAVKDGTVTATVFGEKGYGWYIDIVHEGHRSRYAHMSQIGVKRGVPVKRGDPIGISGGVKDARGSGNSTGSHLHFEIHRIGGQAWTDNPFGRDFQPIDPLGVLPDVHVLSPGERRLMESP